MSYETGLFKATAQVYRSDRMLGMPASAASKSLTETSHHYRWPGPSALPVKTSPATLFSFPDRTVRLYVILLLTGMWEHECVSVSRISTRFHHCSLFSELYESYLGLQM